MSILAEVQPLSDLASRIEIAEQQGYHHEAWGTPIGNTYNQVTEPQEHLAFERGKKYFWIDFDCRR